MTGFLDSTGAGEMAIPHRLKGRQRNGHFLYGRMGDCGFGRWYRELSPAIPADEAERLSGRMKGLILHELGRTLPVPQC
jgi:hypothetical protein